jgi:hypothetical protein
MDNARTIVAVGHHAAFYRDSNGSGRASSRTSMPPPPPGGIPDPVYAVGNTQPGGQNGGNQAAGGQPGNVVNAIPGTAKKGGGLGAGGTGGTTNTNQNTGGTTGFPKGGGGMPNKGGGLGTGGGGGLPPGGTNTVPNLPVNPAVPNDHRYSAMKWNDGRWANNTFATVINGHNNGATHENAERGHPAFHGKSVWWYIEWPGPDPVKLKELEATTKGSTFDTTLGVMYVRKGQLAAQVDLNSGSFRWNNNAPGGVGPFSTVVLQPNQAGVALTLNAGDRVYFMVDGVGGTTGKIRLGVKMKK